MKSSLQAEGVTLSYDKRQVSIGLSVAIPDGSFTAIVGPNACGKSTLLRALSRLLRPETGQVVLDGKAISSMRSRDVARRIALLPQTSIAPEGIAVADLVARGRHPHQTFLRQWSSADALAVAEAMRVTGVTELSARPVDELSGGQRQRAWIAMALAQETPILLLDEPTSFLDLAHQVELLDLLTDLNMAGRTVVAVLHDLNQACRYATHLIAMKNGAVQAQGDPSATVTTALVKDVFGLSCVIIEDPVSGTPMIVPQSSTLRRSERHSHPSPSEKQKEI